jgi:hypothetical protein
VDGLLLMGAGVVCLVVFVVITVRADRAAGQSVMPSRAGWLVLGCGLASIVSGLVLATTDVVRLFSR